MIKIWGRYLLFLATREELAAFSWRTWLGPALVATWLAGMGRYWDHPSASLLQMFACSGRWPFRWGRAGGATCRR
jgi:hypothetical protein